MDANVEEDDVDGGCVEEEEMDGSSPDGDAEIGGADETGAPSEGKW